MTVAHCRLFTFYVRVLKSMNYVGLNKNNNIKTALFSDSDTLSVCGRVVNANRWRPSLAKLTLNVFSVSTSRSRTADVLRNGAISVSAPSTSLLLERRKQVCSDATAARRQLTSKP